MVKIAPSILAADFSCLREEIRSVELAGADWIHLDVMDGHFVPNITFGSSVIEAIRPHTSLPFDVHLMIENPDQYIQSFATAGADYISVHQEVTPHLHRTVHFIKEQNVKAGVAINPATSISTLEPILADLDLILLMTVNPGFGGQKYISSMNQKIKQISELIQKKGLKGIEIEVDGGINQQTAKEAFQHGATVLVAGSFIFENKDRSNKVKALRPSVD